MSESLSEFCTPIGSGLTPVPESERPRFELPPDVRAELERRLEELREARARAEVAARNYILWR